MPPSVAHVSNFSKAGQRHFDLSQARTFELFCGQGVVATFEVFVQPVGRAGDASLSQLQIRFRRAACQWAIAEMALPEDAVVTFRPIGTGVEVVVRTPAMHWATRFIPANGSDAIQVVERARGAVPPWRIRFAGESVRTHRQLTTVSVASGEQFRLGAFTQYGQLFDLKDWAVTHDDEWCAGLLCVRVGKWPHPNTSAIHAQSDDGDLVLDMSWANADQLGEHGGFRSYVLVHALASDVLEITRLGIDYFEPAEGHSSWPAAIIARFGMARPERLATVRRTVDSIDWQAPARLLIGDDARLACAFNRVKLNPQFAKHDSFWHGNFDNAKQQLFAQLTEFDEALTTGAFLHPLGNPVAIRPLTPMFFLFHLLDYCGHLTAAERDQAAGLIANLAEMLLRADFYPHDYATESPEFPYGEHSFYRGMLNQNFNTDRYVTVGVAGCVLQQHPRAALWRSHAVEQFERQMDVYVWPGGAWEESHTYANHVKLTLLPWVMAMRQTPERVDLMKNDAFREMCRFFPQLLSPKDALLGGLRGVPAVGDHSYTHTNYGNVFGWLATASAGQADESLYQWAFEQMGGLPDHHTAMSALFDPLLLPATSSTPAPTPSLPRLQQLPGFGAAYRGGTIGGEDESLLVVRCGQSWGHYHHDQGSFWWWNHGRLVCGDADLGSGELKFEHRGHNVLGFPGRTPMQCLDRHDYRIDLCEPQPAGGATIGCQIPVVAWGTNPLNIQAIPVDQQPHFTRRFEYDGGDQLTLIDGSTRAPDGTVLWSLHVAAVRAEMISDRLVRFDLDEDGTALDVALPEVPSCIDLQRFGKTIALFCTYAGQLLVHRLTVTKAKTN